MLKFRKLIIWLCKKFNRQELLELIHEINLILQDKYSDLKPRDDFKEKHPNYRDFKVDPLAPLEAVELSKPAPKLNYKELLNQYFKEHGKPLKPVKHTNKNVAADLKFTSLADKKRTRYIFLKSKLKLKNIYFLLFSS